MEHAAAGNFAGLGLAARLPTRVRRPGRPSSQHSNS